MMMKFHDYLKAREWYGGSANDPSNVEDEGDGGDGVEKRMEKPGAFPVYAQSELPPTPANQRNTSKRGCGCKKEKKPEKTLGLRKIMI